MMLGSKQILLASVLLMLVFLDHSEAQGNSCLDHGIDVCCTSDHCPQQQSPDGCFCDENCAQFDDCCADIDQVCTNYKESCNDSDIRLVDGENDMQGRVEVCVDGEWGTVCDYGWSNIDAQVVCTQLNHPNSGAQGLKSARFQEGLGSIHMAIVNCSGDESDLFECSFTNETSFCNHGMDASVVCGEAECTDGEVRLVDGLRDSEGRVEVCLNGVWGTVCDSSWDRNDAMVVCNQLQLSTTRVIAKGGSFFGNTKGPINMNNVGCKGTEGTIFNCSFNENSHCTHNDDAGVICGYQQGCIDGLIRLQDGKNNSEGRVEVCVKGAWNTVCDEGWDEYAAKVICREIGFDYAGAIPFSGGYFDSGSELTDVYLANVTCTGHEHSILHCDYTTPTSSVCPHSKDAGVRCLPGPGHCTDHAIRLVDGPDSSQGRVEVCLFETWGTVCDDRWSTPHAEVVCKELGLPVIGATALSGAYYGIGTGPIHMDDVICTGDEQNLTNCSFTSNEMFCTHANDAGVRCPCVHGDVRLAASPDPTAGRVEVCYFGVWGTVTDDRWNNVDSNVVCRQLGFWGNVSYALSFAFFGAGTGPIHIDNTACDGSEETLLDCAFRPPTTADTHNEDAGALCFNGIERGNCFDGSVRLVDGSTALEGRVEICLVGSWGTVCHNGWGADDAAVVCDQLGYPRVGTPYSGLTYPPGRGRIYMTSTDCDSRHSSLPECPYSLPFTPSCSHSSDAGVKCYESSDCTHGDVRLVGGPSGSMNEGRVEVCYRGVWGTVTSSLFGDPEARVVCKQLGYYEHFAIPRLNGYYEAGTGLIALDGLRCSGDEASLTDCPSREVEVQSSHVSDAGVYCYNKDINGSCSTGSVRLAEGINDREGRLEVCLEGVWSTVCGDELTTEIANVVCRQLGHTGYGSTALPGSYFKNSNINQSQSAITSLSCIGHEDQIWDCGYTTAGVCGDGSEASIRCKQIECTDGKVRLVDGSNDLEGRVEVCIDGGWGTVCDDGWRKESSLVVCKQLGHSDQFALGYNSAFFGAGVSMPILMDNVQCIGNETGLTSCVYDPHTADCSHTEDVGIKCYPADGFTGSGGECMHGKIRLVNGSSPMEGRIELCIDEQWGTVCNDRFTYVDGLIVCRQLGYSDLGATVITDGRYGTGSEDLPIYIDNAACGGDEEMLLDCLFDPHTADCRHDRDVGVKCVPKDQCVDGDIKLVNGSRVTEGRVEVCSGGVWGTIAGVTTRFDNTAAQVACRQLGYTDKYVLPMGPVFGAGEGPVHGYAIQCEGNEPNVLNCTHLKVPLNAINPHVADIGIRCFNLTNTPCTPGDVRLANGSVNTSSTIDGRLEVCLDGVWGTVCGDYWIEDDARVVCKQLGYSRYAALTLPRGHYGLGNVTRDEVPIYFVPICDGTEDNIMECQLHNIETCTHFSDTTIQCYSGGECTEGDTRLINNGTVADEGRLEVCQHGIWGTVCEDLFTKVDARVTCRELGYTETYAVSFVGAYYGRGDGPIHLDNVNCIGNEDSILDCPYDDGTDDCTHDQDVGVACYNESQCEHGAVRLVDGNYTYEGRVEYCLNGIWGTICETYWDYFDAITVCKQIGLEDQYAVGYTGAYYGEGHSEIALTAVDCLNQQPNINQCFRALNTLGCSHRQDVGVACYPERQCPTEGAVRLLDGDTPLEGRVEICLNGVWGSIASNGWSTNDAIVVCKQLGYIDTDATAIGQAPFGETNGRINMHQVVCSGDEDSLLDCNYLTFTVYRDHSEDAGVRCYEETNCITGDVRLMGGADSMSGRVEVCIDSIWTTVNGNGWSYVESRVVCDQLGYSSEVAFLDTGFGTGNGPVGITGVQCTGSEGFLLNCTFSTSTQFLNHNQDVGIRCFNDTSDSNNTCNNGDVRLFGGTTEYEGTVEVCLGGVWGSICYSGWGSDDAQVICYQLGYTAHDNPAVFAAFFGPSTGPILLDNVNCEGTEDSISECLADPSPRGFCTHLFDAGVRCLQKSCIEDSIRLVDGSTSSEGRVEVCLKGIWSTVCDDGWDTPDAIVTCRQLGYSDVVGVAKTHGVFGHGTGPIAVRDAQCTGLESTLSSCQYSINTDTCSHGNDAGVKCYNASTANDVCTLGDIRLVGGAGVNEGSVEVCLDNEWGTVCDDDWDSVDTGVLCTQLGYSYASTVFKKGYYPSNASAIHLDDVACGGIESSLLQCPFDYHVVDCTHAKDAGVKCYPKTNCSEGSVRLVGGPGSYEGRLEVCFSGVWGTVHGSLNPFFIWSEFETRVICSQLGFNRTGSSPGSGNYGIATGPVVFSNLVCQGFEAGLAECTFGIITTGLHHDLDVSVKCQKPPPLCYNGDVRLVGGPVPHWGRVEVCFNETWGTVTDDLWSYNDGIVVCRQLGYSDQTVVARSRAYFGEGTGPIYLDNVRCSSGESRLIDCTHSTETTGDTHSEDAGVQCFLNDECTHGEIKLINGSTPSEGIVNVCIEGTWSTVRDSRWSTTLARIACGQLGYSNKYAVAVQGIVQDELSQAYQPTLLNSFFCSGAELKLVDCFFLSFPNFDSNQVAGVECYSGGLVGNCTLGDIRLVGGQHVYEGRIEMCVDGEWGTVCNEDWTVNDARVVCRQMGFTDTAPQVTPGGMFGEGNGRILFRGVECEGNEANLLECLHDSIIGQCTHSSDAGVQCHPGDGCIDGDVRLVGNTSYSGRVEVCVNDVWGTVCHDYWGTNDARVVCNQLNLPSDYPVAFRQAFFGAGNIPIVLDDIICDGTEANLTQCSYDFDTSDCTHLYDVGVACLAEAQCINGKVRLMVGDQVNSSSGRVEVCVDGVWGTVCDSAFSINDAKVACRAANVTTDYVKHYPGAYYGQGTGPIFYQFVDCEGDEANFTECSATYEVDCTHSQDVGVVCLTEPECTEEGMIKLADGPDVNEGRLEVCLHGVWGTVTDTFFDSFTARTICNILGYAAGGHEVDIAKYGEGTGPTHIENIFCYGSETSILDCRYSSSIFFNNQDTDIGLLCYKPDNCTEGDIRLVNGTTKKEGRIELCSSNTFGTLADILYSPSATVICRQLGYSDKVAIPYSSTRFGQGTGPISASALFCSGDERNITQCSFFNSFFFFDHFYDAGIRCFDDDEVNSTVGCKLGSVRLVGSNSTSEGRVEVCLDGQWGTVCAYFFGSAVANTICGTQGFASIGSEALQAGTIYGESNQSIVLRDLYCTGQEASILECEYRGDTDQCTHDRDLAVTCVEKECTHGDIRLADGSSSNEGRVEVCVGGLWGTVCDDDWDQYDAVVMCRQLGYNSSYALPYHYDHFTGSTIPIALDGIYCNGDESSWSECEYTTQYVRFCSDEENSGLRCFNNVSTSVCATGEHRLVDGRDESEGRVEVCVNGEWSTVCREGGWNNDNAKVVCAATYGLTDVTLTYFSQYFGNGTGPIYLSDISCDGDESSLLDCDHSASTRYCDHSEDIGIRCKKGDECSNEGDIRLTGGSGPHEGRIEICYNGVWGTIATTSFSFESAIVTCAQLGYSTLYADVFSSEEYGAGTGVIHFTYTFCDLPTSKLVNCSTSTFYSSTVTHENDVGIKCYETESADGDCIYGSIQLVNGTSPSEGRVELCVDDEWGTLAISFWSVDSARVACYQAGFAGPGAEVLDVYPGDGPIHMTDIGCSGHYYSLFSCFYSNESLSTHDNDVGVKCQPSDNCTEGDIRLSNGRTASSGFVEVCQQSAWSTISDQFINQHDADVVCQTLGYPNATSYFFRQPTGPPTTLPVGLTFMYCGFRDTHYSECTRFFSSQRANHDYDIGVNCFNGITSTFSMIAPPTTTSAPPTMTSYIRPRPTITSSVRAPPTITSSVKVPPKSSDGVRPTVTRDKESSTTYERSTQTMKESSTVDTFTRPSLTMTIGQRPSSSVRSTTTSSVTNPQPSSAEQNTLSVDINGDFDSSTFPRDNFKRSVAESANQYCETSSNCRRKRSLNARQNEDTRVTANDVIIVEVTDNEGGGVIVSFYVMSSSDTATVIEADTLYEAIKMGIEEGVFERAGFDSVMVEPPPTAPAAANRGGMSMGTQAGIAVTVIIIVVIIVAAIVVLLLIVWLKRKNRRYETDKDHILTNRDSFISNRESMIEIDTKPPQDDDGMYITTASQSDSMPVNEKLEFKKLEEEDEITDKDVIADNIYEQSPAASDSTTNF